MRLCGAFAFDRVARSRVATQQEGGGSGQHVTGDVRDDRVGVSREIAGDVVLEFGRAEHQRAAGRCAGEVVVNALARDAPACGCVLELRIDDGDVASARGVGEVESAPRQPLVQEPDASGIGAGRGGAHHRGDRFVAEREEEPLEQREVGAFVFEGEGEVSGERGLWGVAWRQVRQPSASMMRWCAPVAKSVRGTGTARP